MGDHDHPAKNLVEHLSEVAAVDAAACFARLAAMLLREHELVIAGLAHTLVEIEFYLSSEGHRDPFTHEAKAQRSVGRWYFHRVADSYRGGSFKGLDLTFGPPDACGGILIRSLRTPDGALVSGSSLCVDHMLATTGHESVAALDEAIAGRRADARDSPLRLVRSAQARTQAIWATARVGLTLKRAEDHPSMVEFIARPYRFLTEPRAIKKGRAQLIVALHEAGTSAAQIRALTGSPAATIERDLAAYEAGLSLASTRGFWGAGLDRLEFCRLCGALGSRRLDSPSETG